MNQATLDFILKHANDDVRQLALKGGGKVRNGDNNRGNSDNNKGNSDNNKGNGEDVDLHYALEQIAGRQAARKKLPSWAATEGLEYPAHLSVEQCSGERAAQYKADVARRLLRDIENGKLSQRERSTADEQIDTSINEQKNTSDTQKDTPYEHKPTRLIDLTGGFGVDFSFMARAFDEAVYVERQERLCDIARRNMPLLGLPHAKIVCADSTEFFSSDNSKICADSSKICADSSKICADSTDNLASLSATLIFLDPARRDDKGGRTYGISDCTPDVVQLRDALLARAEYVMVKLSPMLDWRKAVDDLGSSVGEVHIVAVGGECKDLLIVMSQRYNGLKHLYCVNDEQSVVFDFRSDGDKKSVVAKSDSTNNLVSSNIDESAKNRPSAPDEMGKNSAFLYEPEPQTFKPNAQSFEPDPQPYDPKPQPYEPNALFLFEPNAAVMKAGLFSELEEMYAMRQVDANSHLFVSSTMPASNFPGRRFRIDSIVSMNKKELRSALNGVTKANITVRNFPLSVAELRKRLKLSDGGDLYIFATTVGASFSSMLAPDSTINTQASATHVLMLCSKIDKV